MSGITLESISTHAQEGQYYDHEQKEWEWAGPIERTLRYIFSKLYLVDTLENACIKRSWKAIEKLNEIPDAIAKDIDDHFKNSRIWGDSLHKVARSITEIYARVLHKRSGNDFPLHFTIEEGPKEQPLSLDIKNKHNETMGTMTRTTYARWNLNALGKTKYTSDHDDLTDTDSNEVVASVTEGTYVPKTAWATWDRRFFTRYQLLDRKNHQAISFTVGREGNSSTFVVRSGDQHETILAIAQFSKEKFQRWSVTLTDAEGWEVAGDDETKLSNYSIFQQKNTKLDFLMWVLLKNSQKHSKGFDIYTQFVCE